MASKATRDFRHEFDPTHQYLNELTSADIFEGDEEIEAFQAFEKARKKHQEADREYQEWQSYLSKLNGQSTKEDHAKTKKLRRKAERYEQKRLEARNKIVEANTRLVISVARKYTGHGVQLADLIQCGNIALFKAVEKFDYHLGYKFSTYAHGLIRQGITRAIADTGNTIRKPAHIDDKIKKVRKGEYDYYREFCEWPTIKQLADYLNMDAGKVEYYLEISQHPLSLEQSLNEYNDDKKGFTGHDVLAIQEDDVPQTAEANELSEVLAEVISALTPREGRILSLRFGLVDGHSHTLEEVGKKFGVTRERIRQLEAQALKKLRHPRRARRLIDFLEV